MKGSSISLYIFNSLFGIPPCGCLTYESALHTKLLTLVIGGWIKSLNATPLMRFAKVNTRINLYLVFRQIICLGSLCCLANLTGLH